MAKRIGYTDEFKRDAVAQGKEGAIQSEINQGG